MPHQQCQSSELIYFFHHQICLFQYRSYSDNSCLIGIQNAVLLHCSQCSDYVDNLNTQTLITSHWVLTPSTRALLPLLPAVHPPLNSTGSYWNVHRLRVLFSLVQQANWGLQCTSINFPSFPPGAVSFLQDSFPAGPGFPTGCSVSVGLREEKCWIIPELRCEAYIFTHKNTTLYLK